MIDGGAGLDPKVTSRVMQWGRNTGYGDDTLSVREITTVKTYLRRALEKLDCHNRSEAAATAARRGLL